MPRPRVIKDTQIQPNGPNQLIFPPDKWLLKQFCDEVSLSDADASTLVDWCLKARKRKAVVMVGAGFSLNAVPKPGWKDFCDKEPRVDLWSELADRFRDKLTEDESKTSDPLWLAELYEQKYKSRNPLIDLIREAVPVQHLESGSAHEALAKINWETVLTTNYDLFIEDGFEKVGRRCHAITSDMDLSFSDDSQGTSIIHVHGTLDKPETIIVTLEDYRTYEKKHPGILVKIRQLFLEHPLLLIGFGATDPNFIEWSGWVRDLVGKYHLPAINISLSEKAISEPRRRYWEDTFSFVRLSKSKIGDFFEVLRQGLEGVDNKEQIRIFEEELKLSQSVPDVIACMSRLGDWYRTVHLPDRVSYFCTDMARSAAHRIVEIRNPERSDILEATWNQITGLSRELAEGFNRQPSDSTPTREEQLRMLRQLFGNDWTIWLLAVSKLELTWLSFGHLHVIVANECEKFPVNTPKEIEDELRYRVCMTELDRDPDQDIDSIIEKWIGKRALKDSEQETINNAKAQKSLRVGDTLNLQIPVEIKSPMELRKAGFIAALESRFHEAADLYLRAVKESSGTEQAHLECLTVEAALTMQWASDIASENKAAEAKSTKDLESRRDYLRQRCQNWVDWVKRREIAIRKITIERLNKRLSSDPKKASESFSIFQEPLLSYLEDNWADPFKTGNVAEPVGHLLWLCGDKVSALRILSRYGLKLASTLVEDYARSRNRQGIADIIDSLLVIGRWPPEWVSRLEALTFVMSEMHQRQLESVVTWLTACSTVLTEFDSKLYVLRGSSISHMSGDGDISKATARIVLSRWRYLSHGDVIREWNDLKANAGVSSSLKDILVSEIAIGIGDLPWKIWIYDGLEPKVAQQVIGEAIDRLEQQETRFKNGTLELISGFAHLMLKDDPKWPPVMRESCILKNRVQDRLTSLKSTANKIYENEILYWSLRFTESESERIQIVRDAVAQAGNRIDGRPLVLQVIAVGVYHAIVSSELKVEVTNLLRGLQKQLAEVELKCHDDETFIEMLSMLCSKTILANLGDGTDAMCFQILEKCLFLSPISAKFAAEVPVSRLSSTAAARLNALAKREYSETDLSQATESDLVRDSIWIYRQRVVENPEDGLGQEWVDQLCSTMTSDDQLLAQNACSILELAIRFNKLGTNSGDNPDIHRVAKALLDATKDPRADVIGCVAASILNLLAAYPETENHLQPALDKLRDDHRVEVRFKIHEAETRIAAEPAKNRAPSSADT